jgi:hypothetical protein
MGQRLLHFAKDEEAYIASERFPPGEISGGKGWDGPSLP